MNIEFYVNNSYFNVELAKSNLFLCGIGRGKTYISNLLYEGLSAKGSHDFVVNGVHVDKSMFDVVFIDECFDFDDYLKFKVKGSMFKEFKSEMLEDNVDAMTSILGKFNKEFESFVFSKYYDVLNDSLLNGEVILQTGVNKIDDLYDSMFRLAFNTEHLSMSSKIEIVIKHSLLFAAEGKSTVIIIDDVILKLSRSVLKSVLELIDSLDNIYVIFTSSAPICFNDFDKVLFSDFSSVSKKDLYQKLFLYDQWDKDGDVNVNIFLSKKSV